MAAIPEVGLGTAEITADAMASGCQLLDAGGLRVRAIFVASFSTVAVLLFALAVPLTWFVEWPLQHGVEAALGSCCGWGREEARRRRRRSTWTPVRRQTMTRV